MRKTYRVPLSPSNRGAETGSITILLLVLSTILVVAAVSSLGYATLWRSKVILQLRLDRCVETTTQDLLDVQNTIEASNRRMRAERAAALAAAVPTMGESIEAAKVLLLAELVLQEGERLRWAAKQGLWIARRGCDSRNDRFLPLPALRWFRPPPDSLGPKPLEWEGRTTRLPLRLWRENRFSQAAAKRDRDKWTAEWIQISEMQ